MRVLDKLQTLRNEAIKIAHNSTLVYILQNCSMTVDFKTSNITAEDFNILINPSSINQITPEMVVEAARYLQYYDKVI